MQTSSNENKPESESLVNTNHKINEKPSAKKKRSGAANQLLGIFFGLVSTFFASIGNIFARKAALFSGSDVVFVAFSFIFICMLFVIWKRKESVLGPKEYRMTLFWQALVVTFAIISLKTAIKLISPSDATALLYTNVIMVALLARFLFKEFLSFVHVFCLFIAIAGIFIYMSIIY